MTEADRTLGRLLGPDPPAPPTGAEQLNRLAERAVWHAVLPAFLARAGARLPEDARGPLVRAAGFQYLAVERLKRALAEALAALARAGLTPVALKGPAMIERLYPAGECRASIDLDLLLAPEEVPAAVRALAALGYGGFDPAGPLPRDSYHVVLEHESRPRIELHFKLARDAGPPVEAAGFLQRARTQTLSCGEVRILSPEDEFLFLAIHGAKHAFSRLYQLYELRLAAAGLDWEAMAARAGEIRYGTALWLAAVLLRDRLACEVPLNLVRPNWIARRFAAEILRGLEKVEDSQEGADHWRQFLLHCCLCDPAWYGGVLLTRRGTEFLVRHWTRR